MGNQLGWVQFSKALDAGRASARRHVWSDDERPARASHRDPGVAGHVLRRVFRPGRTLMLIALVAVTIVSWAVKAGATPPSQYGWRPSGGAGDRAAIRADRGRRVPRLRRARRRHCVVLGRQLRRPTRRRHHGDALDRSRRRPGPDRCRRSDGRKRPLVRAADQRIDSLLGCRILGQLGDGLSGSSITPVDVAGHQ